MAAALRGGPVTGLAGLVLFAALFLGARRGATAGPAVQVWAEAVDALDPDLPIRVEVLAGLDATLVADAFGLRAGGATLVRPDGVIAARWVDRPTDVTGALASALAAALDRPVETRSAVAA